MKRQLDKKEKELTLKGLKRNEEELRDLKEALSNTKIHKEFIEQKRKYEDTMRPYNRKNEDKEIDKTIKGYEGEIKMREEVINDVQKQLKEGIEVKEKKPCGVE